MSMDMRLLFVQFQVMIAVLVILTIRPGMKKLPAVYSYMLWLLVFARLLFPVTLESRFGLMPSASEGRLWLEEVLGRAGTTGQWAGAEGTANGSIDEGTDESVHIVENAGTPKPDSGLEHVLPSTKDTAFEAGINYGDADIKEQGADGQYDYLITDAGESGFADGTGYGNTNMDKSGFRIAAGDGDTDVRKTDFSMDSDGEKFQLLWEIILPLLWAMGTVGILVYNGAALLLVRRQVRRARRLKENVSICNQVKMPFILGMFRPVIYLPAGLRDKEQEYIICHEMHHIRRKDYLVKDIAFLLTAIYWFNPFVWVAFRFMERDMEMSCDEAVIRKMGEGIKKEYSQSLLNFAKGACPAAITPITFGENSVRQRVANVLSCKTAPAWAAVPGAVILLIAAAIMFTVKSDARESGQDGVQTAGTQAGAGTLIADQPGEGGSGMDSSGRSVRVGKEICTLAELVSVSLSQLSPDTALDCWARAFTDRNGSTLYQLAADEEGFKEWELVSEIGEGGFAFGESSPWPWKYDFEIVVFPESYGAEITFRMMTSVPEIYLWKEKVVIRELQGLYYIDHESTWNNYNIETGKDFQDAYGNDETTVPYDDSFYRAILAQLMNGNPSGFYDRFTNPTAAAREMFHLGEGEGEVTEWNMAPVQSLRGEGLPAWIYASSKAGEGSSVIVTYTFAKDGSTVEIPMELKEESQGIWGPVGGGIREVYDWIDSPEMIEHVEGKADLTYLVELSNYGIYRRGAHSGLTCLWMGDVGPDAAARMYEDRLYIFQSLERAAENSDDGEDVVFALNLKTGEINREHLAIPQNYRYIFPDVKADIWLRNGFVQIDRIERYMMPIENLNEPIWNHKTFRQMDEEDINAYSVDNREYLLGHPDTLVRLSIREAQQTSVYIDLDGDGRSEQVILSADTGNTPLSGYDNYRLQVGESFVTGFAENLHNDIWAYSPDGERIVLALYEDGPSGDPYTHLFHYKEGELKALGGFGQDIRECTMKGGVISGTARCDAIQTDAIYTSWQISDSGELEQVPRKVYDFAVLNDIELLEELPVQNMLPSEEGINNGIRYFTISPQTVHFVQTDSTFTWICVETADGSRGWFHMDGFKVEELGKDCVEVFSGLFFVD